MKKLKNRRRVWVAGMILVFAVWSTLFFVQTNPVVAMFGDGYIAEVLFRVWTEVLPASKAGSYYQALVWKHAHEYNQLLIDHPERGVNTLNTITSFIPVLEAQPEDTGDEIRITEEQLDGLKMELDWISSLASPSFREDIEREQERFPLENFVGMTMYEALDFMDSNWPAELTAESVLPPTATPAPTNPPISKVLVCRAGPSVDCIKKPALVANSDGKWAYYVIDNVYFEYPSDWDLNQSGESEFFSFSPAADSSESLNAKAIIISSLSPAILEDHVRYDRFPCTGWPERPVPLWTQSRAVSDFKGSEFFWKDPGMPDYYLDSVFYNKDHQVMICFTAVLEDEQAQLASTSQQVDENFEIFQHVLESIKIWDETQPIQPIATLAQDPNAQSTLQCSVGPDQDCLSEPSLVPDTDGLLAYQIVNGVYYEYPSEWRVEQSGGSEFQTRIFTPASDSFEDFNTKVTILGITQNVQIPQDAKLDELSCSTDPTASPPGSTWHQRIRLDDFEGSETLWGDGGGDLMYLEAVLYNRERQQMVCLITEIYPDALDQWTGTQDIIQEKFPSFHHVLESIRILDE